MTELPAGTVTFLFTDIEGSTRLLQRLGDRYEAARREHDAIIRGAIATLDATPNNIPLQLTSFIGRDKELNEIKDLLRGTRLLTLSGVGGAGKTRLALQLARVLLNEYADGAFFVDLSAVTDPRQVPSAVARALGISEAPERSILDRVKDYLQGRQLLLVIDNFEHVTEAAAVIQSLLAASSTLMVVVTSRIALSVPGEQEYVVPALQLPESEHVFDFAVIRETEAVRLFIERAHAADPQFELSEDNAPEVAEITRCPDGLPLAIELAANRTKVLTPSQMLPQLKDRLSILTTRSRTVPERQRTLRNTIAWSYDLLPDSEKRLFARLSVFNGGWSYAAAEAVCDTQGLGLDLLDGLTSLVDKSLVRRVHVGDEHARFSMLEIIRKFGQEELSGGGDRDLIPLRHADYFLGLVVEAGLHLTTGDRAS